MKRTKSNIIRIKYIQMFNNSSSMMPPLLASNAGLLHNNNNNEVNQETIEETQQPMQASQIGDEELKKKIALYYHTLFQGSLAQWFVLLQQKNYTKLTKKQYIDLNIRIQKSLILDFDHSSAQESAIEDWKIDIERETQDKKAPSKLSKQKEEEGQSENPGKKEPYLIEFERLSEFFFDLCLSWCQHLELEVFLYFVNGVFLNITKGSHVNVSEFKPLEEIEVLSIDFFNHLLNYRSQYEQLNDPSYQSWYNRNFSKQSDIVRSVEKHLQEAFKDKVNPENGQVGETRVLDLWMDMPQSNQAMQNGYLQQHFEKLDKDFIAMNKATKAQGLLIQSMNIMDQSMQQRINDKMKLKTGFNFNNQQQQQQPIQQAEEQAQYIINPYIQQQHIQQQQQQQQQQTLTNTVTQKSRKAQGLQNTRDGKQAEIEKQLLAQLGDRYKHAKLLEVSEGSYLITMDVRLPVFGKAVALAERKRDKKSILTKGYLFTQNPQKYTSQRSRVAPGVQVADLNQSLAEPLSGLDAFSDQITSSKNVVYEKLKSSGVSQQQPSSQLAAQRRLVGDHYLAGGTIDSESDMQVAQIQQHQQQQQQLQSFDKTHLPSSMMMPGIGEPGDSYNPVNNINIQQHQIKGDQAYVGASSFQTQKQMVSSFQGSISGGIDEQALKLVYDRFLQLLQEDKNATIDNVLQEEDIKRQLSSFSLPFSARDLEAAVIERLKAEEESAEIQDMIARFYNKFDELHEQSVQAALAKSPNKLLVKNEIKYKIPEKWTRPFYKHDIVGKVYGNILFNSEQRGIVNKQGLIQTKPLYKSMLSPDGHGVGDSMQAIMQNQYLQQSIPLSNSALQNEMKPQMGSSPKQSYDGIMIGSIKGKSNLQMPQMVEGEGISPKQSPKDQLNENSPDEAESTDVSARGGLYSADTHGSGLCKPQRYDWSEVAHLFEDGIVPEELAQITDPIEYNYILVRLKRDFNENHKSEYMKYMNLQLPYHSRRDEIGGAITNQEWTNFIDRLEGIIDRVQKRRRRIIRRRRKKGNKKMPRKTLFKPIKRPDMSKNPLWCEVFLDQGKDDEDESSSDDEGVAGGLSSGEEMLRQHKRLISGLQSAQSHKKNAIPNMDLMVHTNPRAGLASAKAPPVAEGLTKKTVKNQAGGTSEFTLPPILRPLLNDEPRKFAKAASTTAPQGASAKKTTQSQLKNAQANFLETVDRFPQAKKMMNIRMKDAYQDPFDQLDPHRPSRLLGPEVPSSVKKMEHNYTKKIKKQFKKSIERVGREQDGAVQVLADGEY